MAPGGVAPGGGLQEGLAGGNASKAGRGSKAAAGSGAPSDGAQLGTPQPSQAERMDDSSDEEDGDSLQERLKKEAVKQASAQKVLNPKGARRRSMHQIFLNKYGLDQ